jgi:hypothetical protein
MKRNVIRKFKLIKWLMFSDLLALGEMLDILLDVFSSRKRLRLTKTGASRLAVETQKLASPEALADEISFPFTVPGQCGPGANPDAA